MRVLLNLLPSAKSLLVLVCGALLAVDLPASEAVESRLDPALQARLLEQASQLPRLRSLLVSIGGELVEENYFHGATPSDWANLKSASKSVLSTLVGIALDRGYLRSVTDTLDRFFPEYLPDGEDPAKKTITIEDLLTMRSGLETTSNRNYGRWVLSRDWVRHALTRPLVAVPGSRMIYSTGSTHLLSALLTRASGMSTYDFARRYLAGPLDIPIRPWLRDPQGIYFGGNEMHLPPRAMLKIGQLYLGGGSVGDQRVVSEGWIGESLKPRTQSPRSGREYGYGWWMDRLAGHRLYFARGYGGQFIFVGPDLDLVAVVTSSPEPGRGRRQHTRAVFDLMETHLLPGLDRAGFRRNGGVARSQ